MSAGARDFQTDLRKTLGAAMWADRGLAAEVYAALCNTDWNHDDDGTFGCTWRYAGGLVATIRGQGEDYLDFYCSGNEGQVSERVSEAMAEAGWKHSEMTDDFPAAAVSSTQETRSDDEA